MAKDSAIYGNPKKGNVKVAYCLDSPGPGQLPYCCIFNTNQWLKENIGVDFSIYFHNQANPCIKPDFARYCIEDICHFQGNIICTSIEDVRRCHNSMSKIFFYIQDIYEKRRIEDKNKSMELVDILTDTNIVKFARSEDIKKHYQSLGFNVSNVVVEDYDVRKILEIVNG